MKRPERDFGQIDDQPTAEEEELLRLLDLPEKERSKRETEVLSKTRHAIPKDSAFFTDPLLDAKGNEVTG